jgi:hypothetical protein
MYVFSSVEINTEIIEIYRSEDIDRTKHAFCLNFCSTMTLYIIRDFDHSASSKINCHFCSTYTFFPVVIDVEIDEVRESEDFQETKHTSYLNFYSSMALYMIRVLNYSTSSKTNYHFCSMYAFSFVKIDAGIDEVHRSEDIEETKHTSYLNFYSSKRVT